MKPLWKPVSDTAGTPRACSAMASSVQVVCSPVDNRESSSRLLGSPPTALAISMSRSVVLPMALQTTAMLLPAFFTSAMRSATAWIFSMVATLVPPYLWTTFMVQSPKRWSKADSFCL